MLVDFFKGQKNFAGGIRPKGSSRALQLAEGTIDIIVIKNGYYTPY